MLYIPHPPESKPISTNGYCVHHQKEHEANLHLDQDKQDASGLYFPAERLLDGQLLLQHQILCPKLFVCFMLATRVCAVPGDEPLVSVQSLPFCISPTRTTSAPQVRTLLTAAPRHDQLPMTPRCWSLTCRG